MKLTMGAPLIVMRWWKHLGCKQGANRVDKRNGVCAEFVIEYDRLSAPTSTKPDSPLRNVNVEHLFEAQRLRTDLNVSSAAMAIAGLELHWPIHPIANLNDVGASGKTVAL